MENTETDIEKLKKEIDDLKKENYLLKNIQHHVLLLPISELS